MKSMQKSLLATLLLAGIISTANAASVTYDYQGNFFDSFQTFDPLTNGVIISNTLPAKVGPRITGSATFADGIDNPVTSYMLSDGINTIDNTMADSLGFTMSFINNDVHLWSIVLVNNEGNFGLDFNTTQLFTANDVFGLNTDRSIFSELENGQFTIDDTAFNSDTGTWTLRQEQVSEVPVPAALPLMASALGLFGLARSRKQFV